MRDAEEKNSGASRGGVEDSGAAFEVAGMALAVLVVEAAEMQSVPISNKRCMLRMRGR